MTIQRWSGLVVVLAGISSLVGCGASFFGDDPATGVTVSVTRGPIRPVAREGEVNEEPVAGAVVQVRASSGGSAEAVTGTGGTAVLQPQPGDYRVTVTQCPGALALPGGAAVTVTEGRIESVTLSCDTGIR